MVDPALSKKNEIGIVGKGGVDKIALARNFSRSARFYDRYCLVQTKAGQELLRRIKGNSFKNILELGCGTGNYTRLLKDRFRRAQLLSLDISEGMIARARDKLNAQRIAFMVADAECLNLKKRFGLVTSNAALQWLVDLAKSLQRFRGMLENKGIMAFSIFGPKTFYELNETLKAYLPTLILPANNFADRKTLQRTLAAGFNQVKIEEIKYEEAFFSLRELLKKIKYSGIRGNGLNGKFSFSRKSLKQIEQIYLEKFGRLKATYQVFLCQGIR